MRVEACGADFAETVTLVGGRLSDRKGVNVPGVALPISALTDKDRADLAFALDLGVDWVALSFVQRPEDVAEGRKLVAGRAGILVKLEKPLAIESLEGIVELADAVMVARGDLGVEMPPEDVPPNPEANHPGVSHGWEAGRGGDSDARTDDRVRHADARRDLGCR